MISVETSFDARLTRDYLKAIGHDLENLRPLLEQWMAHYKSIAQPAIFEAHAGGKNGGLGHPTWQALTQSYLASSLKRGSPHPRDMLQLSGAFAQDLIGDTAFSFDFIKISGDQAEVQFGSTREYPRWVGAGQGGSRQAMYITADEQHALEQITNHFLSSLIVKHRAAGIKGLGP